MDPILANKLYITIDFDEIKFSVDTAAKLSQLALKEYTNSN
jgi:hypothetical protein